jgi:hypothetical protein
MDADLTAHSANEPDMQLVELFPSRYRQPSIYRTLDGCGRWAPVHIYQMTAETISGQHHLKRVTSWTLSARKREFFNQSNSAKGEQYNVVPR